MRSVMYFSTGDQYLRSFKALVREDLAVTAQYEVEVLK